MSFASPVLAFEEVVLESSDLNRLKLTTPVNEALEIEKAHKELYLKEKNAENFYDAEEQVFESKAGQTFSNFVDNVLINNKLNRKYSEYSSNYLD